MSLPTQYQEYIHLSRYARFRDDLGRRETWEETVRRYVDYFAAKFPDLYPTEEIYQAILNLEVMPSMRALMSAGPALDRDNMAGYNCSYITMDHVRAFDEALYVLMCGTGVGFSCEERYVKKLPEVPEIHDTNTTIIVEDSKVGWAAGFRQLLSLLYAGQSPTWNMDRIRPSGARLKTFGGRASGPEPLVALFKFTREVFKKAQGRRLTDLEVHDIVCKVADCVVVGGVRRSALISLSDLNSLSMRHAKTGNFGETNPQRYLANNSAVYERLPDMGTFMDEWKALYDSKSGERGIFNRGAGQVKSQANGRRVSSVEFGTNPCGEIILRPQGLCNLSEAIVRNGDTVDDLKRKVRLASIIGTFQATLTNFRYVRSIWRKNAEEERLLGVSLTGIMDNDMMAVGPMSVLSDLKEVAIETNKDWANRLGIQPSVAVTTVKPSGTVSQLVDSSSGIHPRHSKYYLRRVRADKKDPLGAFAEANGVPCEPDVTKPDYVNVFTFPVKAPEDSFTRKDFTALEQLHIYQSYAHAWCEHNPSCTIYVKDHEWMEVGAWVYSHFNEIGGISFLPYDGGSYQQAPYEEITEEEYNEWLQKMPSNLDWTQLREETDLTSGMQELSCLAGVCEIN